AWCDVRYGARSLRRSPGTAIAGTLALALGIGLTTVMYSIIYGMLIKGLPFDHAERIALVHYDDPTHMDDQIPLADFVRFRQQQRSLESIGAYSLGTVNVAGGAGPGGGGLARVTAGTFDVTGVPAILGRTFIHSDTDPT